MPDRRPPDRQLQELTEELQRLMLEEVKSLKEQTFGGINEQDFKKQTERLQRIREISADLLSLLKANLPDSGTEE